MLVLKDEHQKKKTKKQQQQKHKTIQNKKTNEGSWHMKQYMQAYQEEWRRDQACSARFFGFPVAAMGKNLKTKGERGEKETQQYQPKKQKKNQEKKKEEKK